MERLLHLIVKTNISTQHRIDNFDVPLEKMLLQKDNGRIILTRPEYILSINERVIVGFIMEILSNDTNKTVQLIQQIISILQHESYQIRVLNGDGNWEEIIG